MEMVAAGDCLAVGMTRDRVCSSVIFLAETQTSEKPQGGVAPAKDAGPIDSRLLGDGQRDTAPLQRATRPASFRPASLARARARACRDLSSGRSFAVRVPERALAHRR